MRPMSLFSRVFLLLGWLSGATAFAAGNVDLSTVPDRDTVQLTIYNSEDLTLVRETRTVTFSKGVNPLQFSWANTLIDPTSVQLRFPEQPSGLDVLDTTYPHERPDVLYWNVESDADRAAKIEISYFTSGITWAADYLAVADAAETQLALESFVRVQNNSGEDYENAQVRLVVGTINLVEQIAQLAQMPAGRLQELEQDEYRRLRSEVARKALSEEAAPAMAAPAPASAGAVYDRPKEVQKEGLGEYFIYTVEGTETIPTGWSKRLRSFTAQAIPLDVVYRYRPAEYGDQLVRLYLLRNDTKSGLGSTPLPDGNIRIFRGNGQSGLSYLAAQSLRYVPIGDKIELNLGNDPEVIFELVKERAFRDTIWLRLLRGNVYQRADDPGLRVDVASEVAGWAAHDVYTQRVRNYTDRAITIEVRRSFPGDVVFRSQLDPSLHDFQTVEFTTSVQSGEEKDLYFEVIQAQGYNAQQNRVQLETGAARL